MKERLAAIKKRADQPLVDDHDIRRVEIIILKYKELPQVIDGCLTRIINHTTWPFKLTIYDNRFNPPNMSKIWNKLIAESTCPYLCIMDSDAFVPREITPCWLTRMMESIDETGIVVPVCANAGGSNKQDFSKPYPSSQPQEGIWGGPVTLYARDVFLKTGPFDEDFLIYGQDSEFSHRALKKVGGAIYRTDVLIDHEGNHSVRKAKNENEIDLEAERLYSNSLYRLKTQGRV